MGKEKSSFMVSIDEEMKLFKDFENIFN